MYQRTKWTQNGLLETPIRIARPTFLLQWIRRSFSQSRELFGAILNERLEKDGSCLGEYFNVYVKRSLIVPFTCVFTTDVTTWGVRVILAAKFFPSPLPFTLLDPSFTQHDVLSVLSVFISYRHTCIVEN